MSLVDDPSPERPEGVVETALWCERCMLPSGVMLELECRDPATGRSFGKMYPIVCVDCGAALSSDGEVIG